ncbi:MAG: LytR C-terminal domain-containing protein, partial [Bacteroidota bacterium]
MDTTERLPESGQEFRSVSVFVADSGMIEQSNASPSLSSSREVHPASSGSSSSRSRRGNSRLKRRAVLGAAGIVLAGFVLVLVRVVGSSPDPAIVEDNRTRAIQLDVLNAVGEPRLAQRVTEYLRSKGFDVVEMGNAKMTGLEQTVVLDRIGNPEIARQVALAL